MNMNRLTKQVIAFVVGIIAFFTLMGIAGTIDYTEEILSTMPQEAYEQIYLELGDGCSDLQIVDKYMSDKKYYDSLSE